ncbi:zwei Ig domain protein zig-8-like [Physella acuta]|uniref:zwei Ig domain protein zig-8-like n=1 Tax=Physella acuta TaxID=109671 RepID=UPI0027DB4447|nr:zwei Ig domain protein zig-8-like [Physella acuta]
MCNAGSINQEVSRRLIEVRENVIDRLVLFAIEDLYVVWRRVTGEKYLTVGKYVFTKDHRIKVEFSTKDNDVTSWDLYIRHVREDDAGIYECQMTSSTTLTRLVELKIEEVKSRVNKEVTQIPTPTTQAPYVTAKKIPLTERPRRPDKEEFVTAGQPIRLLCNVSLANQTLPRSRIEWYKDGRSLMSDQHSYVTRYQYETDKLYVSELMIDNSQLTDSGDYQCRVKNQDLAVVRIYVLPNTNITNGKSEDMSPFLGADSLKTKNMAVSLPHISSICSIIACCNTIFNFMYVIPALCHLLSAFFWRTLHFLNHKVKHHADPT